jgi:hypothetical protein
VCALPPYAPSHAHAPFLAAAQEPPGAPDESLAASPMAAWLTRPSTRAGWLSVAPAIGMDQWGAEASPPPDLYNTPLIK